MKLGLLHAFDDSAVSGPALVGFATEAEAAGAESLWVGEHPASFTSPRSTYPYAADGRLRLPPDTALPDPVEWLAFVAARTERVRLATGVLILPLHPTVVLAKRLATLDALSSGRVLLGVGVGWQREEFDAVGAPFAERGARADEAIDVLRLLWRGEPVSYRGRFHRFDELRLDVRPPNGAVPIIIGGSSPAAARRAGRIGDGWYPSADLEPDDVAAGRRQLAEAAGRAGRDPNGIGITVRPSMSRPGRLFDRDRVARFAAAGVDRVIVSTREAPGAPVGELVADYRDRVLEGVS